MRRYRTNSGTSSLTASRRSHEHGVVIVLVAVVMLFVVGAMAALSIDVVTLYTARSEAQLAADGAALAAARVLANSGATSDPTGTLLTAATTSPSPAKTVAVQVAIQNQVGGTNLTSSNVNVAFGGITSPWTNPTVTVSVQASLPTFFARIWGNKQVTVAAAATAEAYNPSPSATATNGSTPVAPICVKPWLLPNIDPSLGGSNTIFNATTGAITNQSLLGWTSTSNATRLYLRCPGGNCTLPLRAPVAWRYYPGDTTTTFQPVEAYPTCANALTTTYRQAVGGCLQTAIACNYPTANIDTSNDGSRDQETAEAVNCLTHATGAGGGDTVTVNAVPPTTPIEFVAGDDNPFVLTSETSAGADVMVSNSLVTVPVFDVTTFNPNTPSVTIIGYVQLFLNPDGQATPMGGPTQYRIPTTIINMAGCGNPGSSAQPILGNGASPVAVRLISPP